MLWFFQRDNEYLRIETIHDSVGGAFTLAVHMTDGTCLTELFAEQAAFEERLGALEQQLLADRWTARSSAQLPAQPSHRPN
jgi:hypothetical protein